MSVAMGRRKNPLAVFVTRLSDYVLRGGRADWTNLCPALCVLKANAAGFCVKLGPGQCEDFAAAASGQQQGVDGSHPGAVFAIGCSLAHRLTEGGDFVEG